MINDLLFEHILPRQLSVSKIFFGAFPDAGQESRDSSENCYDQCEQDPKFWCRMNSINKLKFSGFPYYLKQEIKIR
ncbi:RNA polymerase-associated transcription-specificity factor [Dirofilaria immitis]